MLDTLFKRKKSSSSAPKLPYRKLTEEEHKRFGDYARSLRSTEDQDKFWQQTEDAAREIIEVIRKGGFPVGEEKQWGSWPDGYGTGSVIYPKNYCEDVKKPMDRNMVIGSVSLWESWGFYQNPISIWYSNSKTIDSGLELRSYLLSSGISFRDSVNFEDIRKEISQLDKERSNKLEFLTLLESKLRGIDLRI